MPAQSVETSSVNGNGSAVSDPGQRTGGHAPTIPSGTPINYDHSEELLATDLEQHRGNAEKLYEISNDLQNLGIELRAKLQKVQTERTSNLIDITSKTSSRRQTNETESSEATTMTGDSEEMVLVFSPSDNGLTVRQRRSMKDTDYIKADLPSFHWWSDRVHIYFEKRPTASSSEDRLPQVVVMKDEIKKHSDRDVTLIRTVKLTQLGLGIRFRRMLGQIKVIYVLSPRPQSSPVQEMVTQNVDGSAQPFAKVTSRS